MRMSCLNCDLDSHLMHGGDNLNSLYKALLAKQVCVSNNSFTTNEDVLDAIDMIQDFDEDRWNQLEVFLTSSSEIFAEYEPKETNFSTATDFQGDFSAVFF